MNRILFLILLFVLAFNLEAGGRRTNFVEIKHGEKPANPSLGSSRLFVDQDGNAKLLNSQGDENSVGGSGKGGLSVFYTESFEQTKITDLDISGTITATITESEAISGDKSLMVTLTASSAGASIASGEILFSEKVRDAQKAIRAVYKYDGDEGDIQLELIPSVGEKSVKTLPKSTSVSSIEFLEGSTTATSIKWNIFVNTANVGKKIVLDDVQGLTDTLSIKQFTYREEFTAYGNGTNGTNNLASIYFHTEKSNSISELGTVTNTASDGLCVTAKTDAYFSGDASVQVYATGSYSHAMGWILNPTDAELDTSVTSLSGEKIIGRGGGGTYSTSAYILYPETSGGKELKKGDKVCLLTNTGLAAVTNKSVVSFSLEKTIQNIVYKGQSTEHDWNDAGPIVIKATSVNPTKGTTSSDKVRWRRVGDSMEIAYELELTGSGVSGSGDYLIQLPEGYKMNSDKVSFNAVVEGIGNFDTINSRGTASLSSTTNSAIGVFLPYDETSFRIGVTYTSNQGVWDNGFFAMASGLRFAGTVTVPIEGWEASDAIFSVPMPNAKRNHVYLYGNDSRAISSGTESIFWSGSALGWVSGLDGSTPTTGNYYEVQKDGSEIRGTLGLYCTTASGRAVDIVKNGVVVNQISYGTSAYQHANFQLDNLNKGDKIAFVMTACTLSNASTASHLSLTEYYAEGFDIGTFRPTYIKTDGSQYVERSFLHNGKTVLARTYYHALTTSNGDALDVFENFTGDIIKTKVDYLRDDGKWYTGRYSNSSGSAYINISLRESDKRITVEQAVYSASKFHFTVWYTK